MQSEDKILAYTQLHMTPEDRKAFEIEMSDDADLRAQVAAMGAVKGVFAADMDDQPKSGWSDLSDRIDADNQRASNDNRRFGFSVLQVACVAVAMIIGWQVLDNTILAPEPSGWTTASAADVGPALQVFFVDDASETDIESLIAELNGRLVDEPSALGLYLVSFDTDTDRDAAFLALQERADIAEEVLKN